MFGTSEYFDRGSCVGKCQCLPDRIIKIFVQHNPLDLCISVLFFQRKIKIPNGEMYICIALLIIFISCGVVPYLKHA